MRNSGLHRQKRMYRHTHKRLKKLEYRGYDSAGIAVFEGGTIRTIKAKGKIKEGLEQRVKDNPPVASFASIGHTRWATHGESSDVNSHPISTDKLSVVHNGIIENYRSVKDYLISKGYSL